MTRKRKKTKTESDKVLAELALYRSCYRPEARLAYMHAPWAGEVVVQQASGLPIMIVTGNGFGLACINVN